MLLSAGLPVTVTREVMSKATSILLSDASGSTNWTLWMFGRPWMSGLTALVGRTRVSAIEYALLAFAKRESGGGTDDVPGAGNGYVDVFNPDGTRVKRFVSNGRLNSPWAVVLAPAGFGSAAGNILIGNFGDGKIGAYDVTTSAFRGYLHDANNTPLVIDGLWDLIFGVGNAPATTLYFSAGPNGETHGLIGTLTAK